MFRSIALLLLFLLAACGAPPRVPSRYAAELPAEQAATATPAVLITLPEGDPTALLEQAVGVPFELPLGEVIAVGDSGISVRFTAVAEDSRCPEDARCLWPGRVVIGVEVVAPGVEAQAFSLALPGDLTPDAPEAQSFGPYSLRLLELNPYPAGPNADPAPYVATLVLEQR